MEIGKPQKLQPWNNQQVFKYFNVDHRVNVLTLYIWKDKNELNYYFFFLKGTHSRE